jgi:hypothetical protein
MSLALSGSQSIVKIRYFLLSRGFELEDTGECPVVGLHQFLS